MSEVFALDESEQFLIRKALEYVYILYENKPMSYHSIGHLIEKFGGTEYQDDIDDVLRKKNKRPFWDKLKVLIDMYIDEEQYMYKDFKYLMKEMKREGV